jgi:hypothetical protein
MIYKMFLKIKGKEYDIEIEDITEKKDPIGLESYSKGVVNKFSKPIKDENPSGSKKE